MNKKKTLTEKKEFIYDLLGISDYQFDNYIKNIATPPIFYYLITRSELELRQIMNDIKFVLKAQKTKQEEQENPDLYTEKKVLLTQDLYLTLLHNDTIQSYFERRKKEIDENSIDRDHAREHQEDDAQEKATHQIEENEDLNKLVKKFNKYYEKYLTTTNDTSLKEDLLIKMDQVFQSFPFCFLDDNIELIGQAHYEILPSAQALKTKIEKERQKNHNVIDLTNSENFIYIYQMTLANFSNYLQTHFFTLEHLEFEEAFQLIWEQILQIWIGEEDPKKEIRFEFYNKEWKLFGHKAGFIGLHDEIVKKLYFFLHDECKKILENFNPQISQKI